MFKIGIVGAGIIGKRHADAVFNNPDCELACVVDIDISKAEEIAAKYNAKGFTDYKNIPEDIKMDAVILNLPHYLHCEATIYFLNKGINVLVEKPMAMTTQECDEMIDAAKRNGVKLAVGHVQRYFSAYKEIKKIIESGKFGKLCMITEIRNINYLPNRPKWFLKKDLSGGGIVMNYGAHTLDKIFYTTGLSVKNVHSYVSNPISDDDIELNAQILLELEDGVTAAITYSGCNVPGEYSTSFYFTDGALKVEKGTELVLYENGEYKNYGGSEDALVPQIDELVKFLKGEESEIVTAEYAKEVISIVEKILG